MNPKFYLLGLMLILLACEEEAVVQEEPLVFNIDAALRPYVDQFYKEAEDRALSLPQNLEALLMDSLDVCGQGHSPDFNGMFDRPTILINTACWDLLNETAKEILVFHELGHALLNRIHIEGILPNGHSKSLMCAGRDFECSNLPDYTYCPAYRAYYVDELFTEDTPAPNWANRQWREGTILYSDLKESFETDWAIFTNCDPSSYSVMIDSTSAGRPSFYSLKVSSDCGDFLTLRKRIALGSIPPTEAIQLKFEQQGSLSGEGIRAGVFVKNSQNQFIAFNRSIPTTSLTTPFSLQIECLETDSDSAIMDVQWMRNTTGEIRIGNVELLRME
ncbi:MAG: hypothetical protein AAF694_06795 [Bacteroidota bacterium]